MRCLDAAETGRILRGSHLRAGVARVSGSAISGASGDRRPLVRTLGARPKASNGVALLRSNRLNIGVYDLYADSELTALSASPFMLKCIPKRARTARAAVKEGLRSSALRTQNQRPVAQKGRPENVLVLNPSEPRKTGRAK